MKTLTRIGGVLAAVVALLLLVAWYQLGSESVPTESSYRIDLDELRRLAASLPGESPVEVRSELIGEANMPRAFIMARESWANQSMHYPVFQLRFPDGRFILIDSGMDAAAAAKAGAGRGGKFHDDAFARVRSAMREAWQIVVTHEHGDHIGGIATFPEPDAIASALRLTPEQLSDDDRLRDLNFSELLRAKLTPFEYKDAVAIAPGVVLKKAPGHTPGSQLVYVVLASGRELLFIGDVAWNRDALTELVYRPRFMTDWLLGENRGQVLAQFRALHELMGQGELTVVTSHDPRDRVEYGLATPF